MFHKNKGEYSGAKVRPPRLNGAKMGVFATRSPHRPNSVGLTLARLEKIEGLLTDNVLLFSTGLKFRVHTVIKLSSHYTVLTITAKSSVSNFHCSSDEYVNLLHEWLCITRPDDVMLQRNWSAPMPDAYLLHRVIVIFHLRHSKYKMYSGLCVCPCLLYTSDAADE